MTMRQLVAPNTGGGRKASAQPSAHLGAGGSLVLNMAADALIGGEKWMVFYEEDHNAPPVIQLLTASASDRGAYTVTRSGATAKVTIKALWQECRQAETFVGHYTVSRIKSGLRLTVVK